MTNTERTPTRTHTDLPRRACSVLAAALIVAAAGSAAADDSQPDATETPMPSLSAGFTHYPYASLRDSSGTTMGETRVTTQHVDIEQTLVFNRGKTRLTLGAGYQRLDFDHKGYSSLVSSVHSMELSLTLDHQLDNTWGVLFVVAPGYADDFKQDEDEVNSKRIRDALKLTLVGAGTYRVSDNLKLGFGVAARNEFGELLPLPVASIDWRIGERLWFKSILPVNAELTWLPWDRLGLRAALQVDGNSFHGDPSRYGVDNPQMNYSAVTADVGARYFILPFMHVTVHGGYTLDRRFEFSDGRDEVEGGEFDLANGMQFGVDLGIGG